MPCNPTIPEEEFKNRIATKAQHHVFFAAKPPPLKLQCRSSPAAATNMVLTLKHEADATLDVPVTGRGDDEAPIVSRYVQIRRQSQNRWYRLQNSAFPGQWTAKVARAD